MTPSKLLSHLTYGHFFNMEGSQTRLLFSTPPLWRSFFWNAWPFDWFGVFNRRADHPSALPALPQRVIC